MTLGGQVRRLDPIVVWQIAVGVFLLVGWEAVGRISGGEWTSRPTLIAAKLAVWLQGSIYPHVATTLTEVVTGLVAGSLLGALAGLLLGRSPIAAGILRPIVVAFYSIPLVALAPLFIMFFGLDMLPKIVLVTIVVFFLLFFNTFAGASSVDRDLIAQVELMGSTHREMFPKGRGAGLHGVDHRRHQDGTPLCAGRGHHGRDAGGMACALCGLRSRDGCRRRPPGARHQSLPCVQILRRQQWADRAIFRGDAAALCVLVRAQCAR